MGFRWTTHTQVDSKSWKSHISARQHKSCDRWSNRHKPDKRNKEMMSLIRPLITRTMCETAAVLTLVMRRCGPCVSAGLICTGSTSDCTCWSPTAVFAGTRQQDSFFFFLSLSITHFPLCLISSDPQWWKVQRPAGQSDGHWTDATRRAVTGSTPTHVSTNQGDLWAEPLRFSFLCNEGQVWGSLSWVITKINEMGGRMKVVWLLPFNELVGFFLL